MEPCLHRPGARNGQRRECGTDRWQARRRRRFTPLHALVSARSGTAVSGPLRGRGVSLRGIDPARRSRRGIARGSGRGARIRDRDISELGSGSREPARFYIHFSGPNGPSRRPRACVTARRSRQDGRRSVSASGWGALERRPHAVHGLLRSGPAEARHPAGPGNGVVIGGGAHVHAPHRSGVGRRPRQSAARVVSEVVPCERVRSGATRSEGLEDQSAAREDSRSRFRDISGAARSWSADVRRWYPP
jgi:hypothetical protein